MNNYSCPFCTREQNLTLFETPNFYVTPSLGQIVEGYLLICTKEHLLSMASMGLQRLLELESLKSKVRDVLSKHYKNPIFFEHGEIEEDYRRAGCCVEHAHVHAVPIEFDIFPDITKDFNLERLESVSRLRLQFFKFKRPYLYYENQLQEGYIVDLKERVPPQYFRKIIASRVGVPEKWDWREYIGEKEIANTIRKLKEGFRITAS